MRIKVTIVCTLCKKKMMQFECGELVGQIFPHALATTCGIEHAPEHTGQPVPMNWTTEVLNAKIITAPPGFRLPEA